ncbi:MAG: hypothetical protein H6Q15_2010 [Bacteroidetes bacterium]|nr:hypothetical protein [Bacteroidota bacterium]
MFIHEHLDWFCFHYDKKEVLSALANVRYYQGKIIGKMDSLGFFLKEEALLSTLTFDIIKSSEIEGENLNKQEVRSSIARRLGINASGLVNSSRDIDGLVEMMLDATQNYKSPLTEERLFSWHSCLFPSGWSSGHKIEIGKYRSGEMQVVSGAMGKERIHYEAPKPERVEKEMLYFLEWLNGETEVDSILKAAIAHFWFITIHPFDDGNGRIARAITDMLLSRSDNSTQRFYSMSTQILNERKEYYMVLELSQRGDNDITKWIIWFLNCLNTALISTETMLESILFKAKFWEINSKTIINERQKLMLNKVLDGFEGKLTSSKWAKISKCSNDTALRDIQDLISKNILRKEPQGGRSTNYELVK